MQHVDTSNWHGLQCTIYHYAITCNTSSCNNLQYISRKQCFAGLGALVGLHIALQHPHVHVQLLGRSGRPAVIGSVTTTLQAKGNSHIIMSKCDVNMSEEAAFAEDASTANILTQVVHSGNFEQCARTLNVHGTAWCASLIARTSFFHDTLPF